MINKTDFINVYLENDSSPTLIDLANELKITVDEVRKLKKIYPSDLEKIQNVRNIFKAKQKAIDKESDESLFKFENFKDFYDWYISKARVCFYCGIEEETLKKLFEKGILSSKRGSKRGKTLEIERIDAKTNEYSSGNCVLACYFCNNHKSDIISEEDHKEYFSKKIGEYLRDKAKLLN